MYRPQRTSRSDRFLHDMQTPSFSSTLLDRIYRSIDEPDTPLSEPKSGEQGKRRARSSRFDQEPDVDGILRACLVGEEKINVCGRGMAERREISPGLERTMKVQDDFFSSNSSSSDSSSSGFSSSDMESIYGLKTKVSSLIPPPIVRTKPEKSTVSAARLEKSSRPEKITEDRQRTPFRERRRTAPPLVDVCHRYPSMEEAQVHQDESVTKSKPRALKIYENLKKVKKQPISPGGRLSNFINSLFAPSSAKKSKSFDGPNMERNSTAGQTSTCSSASSFSRSCLSGSGSAPGNGQKLRGGAKRTVRFYPVSVIVDEDLKPCGHKCLYGLDQSTLTSVAAPGNRKAIRSPGRKPERAEDARHNEVVMEKPRSVEKMAREFLRDYYRNQKRCRSSPPESHRGHGQNITYDDDNDDASSCSSSDLFELDHLRAICSNGRYCEELPVYETTRVSRNLAIANGLMV